MVEKRFGLNEKWMRIVGTVLSIGLLVFLLWKQDWQELWRQVSKITPWVWFACFGLYFFGQVFNALRWFSLLRSKQIPISFITTLKIILSGTFASNFLPSTVGGDIFRVMGSKPFTESYSLSLASVMLDRLLNVCAMLTVLPFTFITFNTAGFELNVKQNISSGAGLWLSVVWRKLGKALGQFKEAFFLWTNQPRTLLLAFGISWLSVFVIFVANTILANHLGIPVKLYQVMGVNAITYLLTLLPITFNGYGVREVLITTLYMILGATVEQASAFAFITRLFMVVETIPGSLWLTQIMNFQKSEFS